MLEYICSRGVRFKGGEGGGASLGGAAVREIEVCVPLGKGGLGMWGWECGELAGWMVLGDLLWRERDGLGERVRRV